MSELYYQIRRSGGQPKTTWLSATGITRKFPEEQDEFIVNEVELGICLHNGNFKLVGPAPVSETPSQPVSVPEPDPIVVDVNEEEKEEEQEKEEEKEKEEESDLE